MATFAAMPPARARAPLASRGRESAPARAPGAARAPSARFHSPRRASYLVRRAPCRDPRPSLRVPGAIAEPEVAEADAETSGSAGSSADAGASGSPGGFSPAPSGGTAIKKRAKKKRKTVLSEAARKEKLEMESDFCRMVRRYDPEAIRQEALRTPFALAARGAKVFSTFSRCSRKKTP